jgi:small subunit ribosomal protein S1
VTSIEEGGLEVEYEGMKSFIRRSDLSRDRGDQRPDRFSVGDKIDVRVTNIDVKTRKLGLSIKAREIAEEKDAVEQYGSSDSGASLGDILGAALNKDE